MYDRSHPDLELIDGYGPLEPIGHGGFSTVYLAHQKIFDRQVAIKVIHADLRDQDAQRRFVRECRAAGRLTGHPNIITVFDAGTTRDQRPYIAMEYLPRGSFADRVKKSGPLGVGETWKAATEVADALAVAHRQGVLHRDLKPANILVRDPITAVLSDFGIASLDSGTDSLTASTAFTAGYAAPEVLRGENHTVASDIFAFGATLFTLLSGELPFPGRVPAQVLERAVDGPAPVVGRDDIPEAFASLIQRMLAVDPSRRPQAATDILGELVALSRLPDNIRSDHLQSDHIVPRSTPTTATARIAAPMPPEPPRAPAAVPPVPEKPAQHLGQEPGAPLRETAPSSERRRFRHRRRTFALVSVGAAALVGTLLLVGIPRLLTAGTTVVTAPTATGTAQPAVSNSNALQSPAPSPAAAGSATPATPSAPATPGHTQPGGITSAGPSAPVVPPPPAASSSPTGVASPQPKPVTSCTPRNASVTDYAGRTFPMYNCSTYVGSAVYTNVRSDQASEALDDSGYMYANASVWVICQYQGRANPVIQGNTNTWWLYTQGDDSRANSDGYAKAWGYLPATAVSQGGQNEAIPGVPRCQSYL